MEKSKNIGAQIYGYAVCLVCVITFILALTALVSAVMNLSDPMHAGGFRQDGPSLASFENYKLDVIRSLQGSSDKIQIPDDQQLKTMYEAARNDRMDYVTHQSYSSMSVSGMLILISIILFVIHWRWMRRLNKNDVQHISAGPVGAVG